MANIVKQMEDLTKACEEFAVLDEKQQREQKEDMAKQFYELKKAVRQILSEKEIIFHNFKFVKKRKPGGILFDEAKYLKDFAHFFSMQYGFHEEKVFEILESKNKQTSIIDELMGKCFILVKK